MNLDGLNDCQKRAVKHTEGPLLIIAGAGSGKTRVLTHRIAYMIDECNINPYNILAITFTNKAAAEMRERVDKVVGDCAGQVWVSTFHSTCVRILRRYIDRLGYSTNFTIYDTDDQKSVIKEVCKKLNIDTKLLKERTIMSAISSAKDEMITPQEMELNAANDYNGKRIANVYKEYQKTLKLNNALDFDDLIFKTVELFTQDNEVLEGYQERFKYIMVDEYQDTNTSQFRLISKLAGKYHNLCVVGDDDQSIYKFRGANISNILNFENTFKGARVIKLEQNYRSTQTILNAANAVIQNNVGRKKKSLWTDNGKGELIDFCVYEDAYGEADGVVAGICAKVRDGWNYNDFAILYRTNAQSRVLEEKLMMRNVPYRIYGGVNFYQRKEIKDILAYLKTIDNGMDSQAVKRIINTPKRGIGATTIERIQEFADQNDFTFWDALCNAGEIPNLGRGLSKLEPFITLMSGFKAKAQFMSIRELAETVLADIRYMEALAENETREEVEARQENIDEFINKIVSYEENCVNEDKKPTLSGFLEEVALIADIDNLDESENHVMLMTLHSAKGLEFPIVYMTGLEDGLFPSYMTIVSDDPTDVEEERRLCYVGITRAQKELTISCAKTRMVRGEMQMNKVSRFVREIPEELIHLENKSSGHSKGRIAYGGELSPQEASAGRFDFRANAKRALSTYGSGDVSKYEAGMRRVKINNTKNKEAQAGYNFGASARTTYGTGQTSDYGRKPSYGTTTSYGSKPVFAEPGKYSVKKTDMNKKVGFGKEFPMDLFDLKNTEKAAKTSDCSADEKAVKSGGSGLGYSVGDIVSHVKFGTGKVVAIDEATRDYMVTVQFEGYGIKKMLAGFARLQKQ
ncbi:MAG: UvrD-helicase domain-containing protein [Eubacteriales bacterium]|nr:UvrD-helicase domain-containing protein [Eubacteriales bacterium]